MPPSLRREGGRAASAYTPRIHRLQTEPRRPEETHMSFPTSVNPQITDLAPKDEFAESGEESTSMEPHSEEKPESGVEGDAVEP